MVSGPRLATGDHSSIKEMGHDPTGRDAASRQKGAG